MMVLFASCESPVLESDDEQPASAVCIHTRAAEGEAFESPLHAYAFDADGHLIAHQQSASDTDFCLSVPQQADTRIVLLSADSECYDIPTSPSLSSLITMKVPMSASSLARGYATSPLQMGIVDVHPQSDNTTVTVQMYYQVASLSVHLEGLPQECTSAYISVASPANGLTFSATANGTQTTRIPLAVVPAAATVPDTSTVPDAATVPSVATVPDGFPSGSSTTFNPTTGLLPSSTSFTRTWNVSASVGKTFSMSFYFMAEAYPLTATVLVEALDAEGTTIASRTFTDITFNRAKVRTINIYLFSGTTSTTLTFEEWTNEDPITIE